LSPGGNSWLAGGMAVQKAPEESGAKISANVFGLPAADAGARRLYPVLSRRATLKKVAATIVIAPSTIRWIAES
jgi:hypothetical protein